MTQEVDYLKSTSRFREQLGRVGWFRSITEENYHEFFQFNLLIIENPRQHDGSQGRLVDIIA